MTEPHSPVRFLGVALMFVASVLAGFAYLAPVVLRARAEEPSRSAALPS